MLGDPRRNSFRNLIDFVETGEDVQLQGEAAADKEESDNHHHHHHHHKKKDKKKKKDESDDESVEDNKKAKKNKKKDKKDKKKDKKKKKHKDGDGGSDVDLDSDDDISLGSMPSSSDDEEEEGEAEGNDRLAGLSRQVSKRASVADGLKSFQASFQKPSPTGGGGSGGAGPNSQRRHTLGAALKGFQIDVNALQDKAENGNEDDLSGLTKNLPRLSMAGVRQSSRRSNFDQFLKNTTTDKDQSEK